MAVSIFYLFECLNFDAFLKFIFELKAVSDFLNSYWISQSPLCIY